MPRLGRQSTVKAGGDWAIGIAAQKRFQERYGHML
jgi:hypothetical protein